MGTIRQTFLVCARLLTCTKCRNLETILQIRFPMPHVQMGFRGRFECALRRALHAETICSFISRRARTALKKAEQQACEMALKMMPVVLAVSTYCMSMYSYNHSYICRRVFSLLFLFQVISLFFLFFLFQVVFVALFPVPPSLLCPHFWLRCSCFLYFILSLY